jgi:apolipoprotein N-acyltransferase
MTPAAPVSVQDAGRSAAGSRAKPSWTRLGAALGAGVVTGLCFPSLGLGPVVLVALVPLLWAWRGARPAHAALYGFAYGVAAYVVVIPWIRYFGYVAIVPLVAVMAAAIAAVGALVAAYARRGLASPFLTAAVWVVFEALRGRFPFGGLPWADLGIALHDVTAARALASVGGTLLVSFVVVAVNGLLLDLGLALRARTGRRAVLAGVGVAGILVATVVVDVTRFEPTTTGHLRVALLQGDDEQLPLAEQVDQPLTEKHFALAERLRGHYDLIVFPETALDTDPEQDPELRERLVSLAEEHDAAVLVNARTPGDDGESRNTNLLYTPDGKLQGTYSKQHLVPFGEYVPWRDALSWLPELRQVPYDFQAGNTRTRFRAGGHPFESVICFESAFGPLVRDAVRDGAQVVVVSTNNRSYQRSANSEQHLALGQMRAAETGRAVLQASVSGISAIIDPDGSVRDETGLFQSRIVSASVPTSTGETLYVRFGDWVVLLSAIAMLVVTVVAIRRPVRAPIRDEAISPPAA